MELSSKIGKEQFFPGEGSTSDSSPHHTGAASDEREKVPPPKRFRTEYGQYPLITPMYVQEKQMPDVTFSSTSYVMQTGTAVPIWGTQQHQQIQMPHTPSSSFPYNQKPTSSSSFPHAVQTQGPIWSTQHHQQRQITQTPSSSFPYNRSSNLSCVWNQPVSVSQSSQCDQHNVPVSNPPYDPKRQMPPKSTSSFSYGVQTQMVPFSGTQHHQQIQTPSSSFPYNQTQMDPIWSTQQPQQIQMPQTPSSSLQFNQQRKSLSGYSYALQPQGPAVFPGSTVCGQQNAPVISSPYVQHRQMPANSLSSTSYDPQKLLAAENPVYIQACSERKKISIAEDKLFFEGGQKFDVLSLLSCDRRDFLLRNNGDRVSVSSLDNKIIFVTCFFVPLLPSSSESAISRAIALVSEELHDFGGAFELVVVAKMRHDWEYDEAAFNQFLSGFPSFCLFVPFWDVASRDDICSSLNFVSPRPTGILVSTHVGEVKWHDYLDFFLYYGIDAYPFTLEVREDLDDRERNYKWWNLRSLHQFLCSPPLYVHLPFLSKNPGGGTEEISIDALAKKLVGVYLCFNGNLIPKLHMAQKECTSQGLEFEIVLVYLPFEDGRDPRSFQDRINQELQKLSISWWVLPFRNWVSRKLWRLCHKGSNDKLIIMGPNSQFVEPHGESMVSAFGPSAYPFSREVMIRRELDRIKSITLESLLLYGSRDFVSHPRPGFSFSRDENYDYTVPVAAFKGRNVLVYLDFVGDHSAAIYNLLKDNYNHLKSKDPGCEVVFVSLGTKSGLQHFRPLPPMMWLVCPSVPQHSESVCKRLFVEDKEICSTVVAFGKDGQICSTRAHDLLGSLRADFSFSDNLRSEIIAGFRKRDLPDCCL